MSRWVLLAGATIAIVLGCAKGSVAIAQEADSIDRDYSVDLKRLPPTSPAKALDTFEVEPGFALQLAAAEPLVTDPVAMDFDEHGRLYVVEMLGYSENAADMLGRIRLLEDSDRDGQFDTSTVFADGLAWPTAVISYDGGVFVGAAPDILYFKDVDGDGRADQRRVVLTGFGMDNVQGLLNSFRWGLDNRIHVAVSRCGADLRRGDQPNAEPLVLRGRNFAFDPRTLEFEATSGASQHGFCFDPWGNAFTCHNSDHIQQIMFDDRDMSRNPYVRPPAVLKSIAVEGPAADVFRISPIEPWREIRTRLRVKGIVPGMIEGGGRAAGYFTSATGVTIYDGDAWPAEFYGNAFIGDVGSNLVHRKLIERDADSVPLVARRATPNREFVASKDTWFRPVQFANGPDGNLYILDMYREVIEHPASLPPVLKKHIDLTSGRDRGRIYRVVRADPAVADQGEQLTRAMPGDATTEELVAMLNHPNGWHRTTATRLLFERKDPAANKLLENMLFSIARSEAKILAIHMLASLSDLRGELLAEALGDSDPHIRENAARMAGRWLHGRRSDDPAVAKVQRELMALAMIADVSCRYETAFALGDAANPRRLEALAAIVGEHPADEYIRAAVLSSLHRDGEQLLKLLLSHEQFGAKPPGREFLSELCRQLGARGDQSELAATAVDLAALNATDSALAGELLVAVLNGAGVRRAAVRKQLAMHADGAAEAIIAKLLKRSLETAVNDDAAPSLRAAAIAALPLATFEEAGPVLVELLAPRNPQTVQSAAIAALGQFNAAAVGPAILQAWPGMGPALRSQAANLMLARGESALALLASVKEGALSPRDLDPSTIQQLKTHADAAVRDQAARLLDVSAPKRAEVVDAHLDVLALSGDAARGREVFRNNCAICHRKEDHGTEVGADLATVVTRTPEALLISILDPNREVDPKYVQYTVLTVDGLAKSGMIASETATSVTLKREQNATETIPRADIESLQSTGMTLMPEGLEKAIDKQSLADLIAYLRDQ